MITIRGVGLATPLGLGRDATVDAWVRGGGGLSDAPDGLAALAPRVGAVPGFRPRKQLPDRKAVKLMSREAQLLVYAAVEAAGTDPAGILGIPAERIGGFAAAGYEVTPLDEVLAMFKASRDPDDPARLSLPRLFSEGRDAYNPLSPLKTLPNMALFHAALTLGLRGPHLALGSSPAAGLAALTGAVDALVAGTCDAAFVGGADAQLELFRLHYLEEAGVLAGAAPGEGAAALLLGEGGAVAIAAGGLAQERPSGPLPGEHYSRTGDAEARSALYTSVLSRGGTPDVVIADLWGLPLRDRAERDAIAAALGGSSAPIFASRPRLGHLGAAHGLVDVALGAALIERGEADRVLVTAGGLAGDLGAVVLRRAS